LSAFTSVCNASNSATIWRLSLGLANRDVFSYVIAFSPGFIVRAQARGRIGNNNEVQIPVVYIAPVDFYQDDYVIVGTPDDVLGILSVADVFIRLNDFAEASVLLHETELALRRLIEQNLEPDGVSAALEAINARNREKGRHGRPLMTCKSHRLAAIRSLGQPED
jgi:hypothetical protein